MRLIIDNIELDAKADVSLHELIKQISLDEKEIARVPLAAQIGGEVYNLNICPIRMVNGMEEARNAVVNAGGHVQLLRYSDTLGRRVYERTMLFVLLLAIRRTFPEARTLVKYALGSGLYIEIIKEPALCTNDIKQIHEECAKIIEADIPFKRERLDIDEARERFLSEDMHDKSELLNWRKFDYFDLYSADGYSNYFYGEMAPSTGYVRVFELVYLYPGMLMLLPDKLNPELPGNYRHSPKLSDVFYQSESWARLLNCTNLAELNGFTLRGDIRELMRINEALHEKSYADMAEQIAQREAGAIMIAGPSSSGKTTSANRLYTQLRALGKNPVMLSLDDYYIDRDRIPFEPDGTQDFEHIETLDIERFKSDLEGLIAGKPVTVPLFDFKSGKREPKGRELKISSGEPLIIEGIHGLNPRLVPASIPKNAIFRVYVSALTTLNVDDHNRIRTTDIRLLRRMVRDYEHRGASPERTLSMWESVQRGEKQWIFPFQEEADYLFNTALVYEIAVLKKHIFPLLLKVEVESPYFGLVNELIKFLNYFLDADIEDEVPPTSVLREFIGKSAFFDYTNHH